MNLLVECVPNFSEGRNEDVIRTVCKAVSATGVRVLSLEPDGDYNRTVLTFVADPELILEGAFAAIKASAENIDMSKHKGGHPRMGACDVTPFVPVAGVSLDDCAELAKKLGARVADELGLPVYLYGAAARPGRRDLAVVRKGQYEGLAEKIKDPDWVPDYGPAAFNPKFGAALIGARPFLIAYNVNLKTTDVDRANDIAKAVRTSGRVVNRERIPGTLKAVKGLGVPLEDKGICQVSMNLVDYTVTNMHQAFEEVKKFAAEKGIEATGSEICGIVPRDALVRSGQFYGADESNPEDAIATAAKKLGLGDLEPFAPDRKVLEYILQAEPGGDLCEG
jgi:glutamate formiminotransferase/formiminotetrahydrofolate cyclodeaminase